MPPKRQRTKRPERFRCDQVETEQFHAQIQDVFGYNWWEIFCFPYILCGRVWECCVTLCAGTNQCIIYWLMIQWIVCKITRITTPDPIIFPYYFYMFCQVLLLTAFFIMLWHFFGKSVLIPYFAAYFDAYNEISFQPDEVKKNTSRLSFRRYCFRKGEIFDTSVNSAYAVYPSTSANIVGIIFEFIFYEMLN